LQVVAAVKKALVLQDLRLAVQGCSVWAEVEVVVALHPLQVIKKAWVVRDLPVAVEVCSAWVEVVVAAEVVAGLSLLALSLLVIFQKVFSLSEAEVEVAAAANLNP
jgi:hypothetical protein